METIINGNQLFDKMIKDYKDVKVGDIGEDYNGNKVRIVAKGTIGNLLSYDSTGAAKEYVCEDDEAELYNGVAVEDLCHKDSRYPSFVYEYGSFGVVVYEKN